MIKINKGNVPREFYEAKKNHNHYDELYKDEKDKLKAILLKEQNNRCAYCNRGIDLETSTIEHYIPRNGKNGDPSMSLDYNNLFAVCEVTRHLPPEQQTCDVKRGDKLLQIDPRNQNHIDTIKYNKRGIISSNNNAFDDDLNRKLNLNAQALIESRVTAFDTLIKGMAKRKNGKFSKDLIQRTLKIYKAKDNCTPYVGYIIYRLEDRLKRF